MNRRTKGGLAAVLAAVVVYAVAEVIGPFFISAAGPEFAQQTLSSDASDLQYLGAQKIAAMYLPGKLNTPFKIIDALLNDYMRVVYYDGQIADFKIRRFPSSIPLNFDKVVPSRSYPRKPATGVGKEICRNGKSYREYSTGYWGSTFDGPSSGPPAAVVTMHVFWVDTGTVTEPGGQRSDCVK